MATELLKDISLPVVFGTVLLAELGLPIPYLPILILGGASVAEAHSSPIPLFAGVLLACLVPNYIWYRLGVSHGRKILGMICRISLSPDVCVSQTEDIFLKWGPIALPLSKFVPGLALISSPLAGALGFTRTRFLILDLLGIATYCLFPISLGYFFHDSVSDLLLLMSVGGKRLLLLLGIGLILFMLWKWYKRYILRLGGDVHRMTIEDLRLIMKSERPYVLVDVRSSVAKGLASYPGAIFVNVKGHGEELAGIHTETEIIAFCSCPNEVSAAKWAKNLSKNGYKKSHALIGGFDALSKLR